MPLTFTNGFCQAANLRSLLKIPAIQNKLQGLHGLIDKYIIGSDAKWKINEVDIWGKIESPRMIPPQIDHKKTRTLSEETYGALCDLLDIDDKHPEPTGQILDQFKVGDVIFAPHIGRRNEGNSMVSFGAGDGKCRAGKIQEVLLHSNHPQPLFKVYIYKELNDNHRPYDPFIRFPDLHARICYSEFEEKAIIVPYDQITSHFSSCNCRIRGIDQDCIVVLDLDRVRIPTLSQALSDSFQR